MLIPIYRKKVLTINRYATPNIPNSAGAPNSAKFRGGGLQMLPRFILLPGSIFEKVHFLAFLRKAIKKGLFFIKKGAFLRVNAKKGLLFRISTLSDQKRSYVSN